MYIVIDTNNLREIFLFDPQYISIYHTIKGFDLITELI